MQTTGERIREIRNINGQTQNDFGLKIGVDAGHISKIETGKAQPSTSLVRLICLLYNVSEAWMTEGQGPRDIDKEQKPDFVVLNTEVLKEVIRTVEEMLKERNADVTPEQKAECLCFLYEDFMRQDAQFRNDISEKKKYIARYLTMMGISGNADSKKQTAKVIQFSPKNGNVIGNIVGNGNRNITSGNNVTIKTGTGKLHVMPPPDSIGSDPYLKQQITEKFNRLGETREIDKGKSAYPVMYNQFKKDFKIKNQPWTIIWTWPRNCADGIIEYLDFKYKNTKPGRMENAANREDHIPARPVLYNQENQLLSHFGLEHGSPEVRELMRIMFGVTSHKHLTHLQHWQFVKYLEEQVDRITGK